MVEEILTILNPWWKDKEISQEISKTYKRKIFKDILKLLKYKQIIILSGLRRVGKTTLFYQTIEKLLKKNNEKNIVYFNFDKKVKDINELLETYSDLTNIDWKKEKIFVFLDEISKLEGWANKLKLIYDAFPNIKFFISSSSSISLEEEAIKNLAGRYFLKDIKPLSFIEYLGLKEKDNILNNPKLYKREIEKEIKNYLLRSFPEIVGWNDELLVKDYLKTTIVDKIVKSDLSDKFKNVNKDLLFNLLEIFYSESGMYLDYDGISKKLRISKKTLLDHIYYLEFSYLLKRIKNFRPGVFTASRKMQRAYAYWFSLLYCYSDNNDKIMENVVANITNSNYYWRKNGKEIDFLIVDKKKKKIIPIEVKNKKELIKRDLDSLKYFLKKYKMKEAYIIYQGKEDELKIDNKKIKFIPLWKWLL